MRESAHPVALIEGVFAVDVVGVNGGVISLDSDELLVWMGGGVRLLERVASTCGWRRGLSRLTA